MQRVLRGVLQPQEVEVYFIIPAIRKALAQAMKKQGLEQKDIAHKLGLTPSAISQYIHNKRAADLDLGLDDEVEVSAKRITDTLSMFTETQRLLQLARSTKVLCKIHEKIGGAPRKCDACFPEAT